jgi:isopenicillin-N epimerase
VSGRNNGPYAHLWDIDPEVDFLNHGSYGATPRAVLEQQSAWRARAERQPIQFFGRDAEPLIDAAKATVAGFVGARPADLTFVVNATEGVSTVLRSMRFEPGDVLLTTNHVYNACANALRITAERWGAQVRVAEVPFPISSADEVVAAIEAAVDDRVRIALIDHVTSPTALVFPMAKIAQRLEARGIRVLVDGAHAPGMIDLNVEEVGASWYTGNLHKWTCSPKGAGFLWVRPELQGDLHPLAISHGENSPRHDRSPFELRFGWVGTRDFTPWLGAADSITFLGEAVAGGWPGIRRANHALALLARDTLCARLGVGAPAPDDMLGSMAAVPIADEPGPLRDPQDPIPLQRAILDRHHAEAPIVRWPQGPHRLARVSAQLYNSPEQYSRYADALIAEITRESSK